MSQPLDIVTAVMLAIQNDDDNQSERLEALYDGADHAGKALLDDMLICLTGYNMTSLRGQAAPMP